MISAYPDADPALDFPAEEQSMERIIAVIKAIRNRRAEMNVPPSRKTKLFVISPFGDTFNESVSVFFTRLASASEVAFPDAYEDETAVRIVTDSAVACIPLADMIDAEKELARLTKEKEKLISEIDRLGAKLANEGFLAKAPAAVVENERAKLAKYRETLAGLDEAIGKLPQAR